MSVHDDFPLEGKLFFRIPLRLASPLIIGSGDDEFTDLDVQKEQPSGKPFIPATSMIGVFRHFLIQHFTENSDASDAADAHQWMRQIGYFFGECSGLGAQSAVQCEDIVLGDGKISRRDGVAISPASQTALDEKKYDYQIVESDEIFYIALEVSLRSPYDRDMFIEMIHQIIKGIGFGIIRLGAKTNKGFGRLQVAGPIAWDELDFSKAADVMTWLTNSINFEEQDWKDLPTDRVLNWFPFEIDAQFSIRDSLLIRSYPTDPEGPDAISIRQRRGYTLPGTSLMGVIRHRAKKIMASWGYSEDRITEKMRALFGHVPEEDTNSDETETMKNGCKKGRLRVEEYPIEEKGGDASLREILQTRIKIDRFTGGTFEGALIQEMPLYQTGDAETVTIRMIIPDGCKHWEAKVLLLVLKDLWSGDLAVGGEKNIGRGALQGIKAKVIWGKDRYDLEKNEQGFIKESDDFKRLIKKFAETSENE